MKKLFCCLLMTCGLVTSRLSAQIFISFDDLKGESTAPAHATKNETEIMSFTFNATNQAAIGSATGGAGAGKAKFDQITFMKTRGSVSGELFKKLVAGGHFNNVKISYYKNSDSPWMTINLGTVFVSSISLSASGTDVPTEAISLTYGTIMFEEQYGPGPKMRSSWNILNNSAVVNQ